MVLDGARISLLAVVTAASVSLSSEAGAVGAFGTATTSVPGAFTASLAVQGSMLEWLGVPNPRDEWTTCVEAGGRVRLRGRHGLKLEPLTARVTDAGIWYAMPPDRVGSAGATGLLAWRDVRSVDVWKNEPAPLSVTTLCGIAGLVGGYVIANAIDDDPKTVRSIPAHFAIRSLEALPFGVLGYLIGHAIDPKPSGRWVACEDAHVPEH